MDSRNSVLVPRNYGKITFHFGEVMDRKKIKRNQLANLADIRFEVADRYYKGNIERLDIDVLARICFVLECQIDEVIKYVK